MPAEAAITTRRAIFGGAAIALAVGAAPTPTGIADIDKAIDTEIRRYRAFGAFDARADADIHAFLDEQGVREGRLLQSFSRLPRREIEAARVMAKLVFVHHMVDLAAIEDAYDRDVQQLLSALLKGVI